MNEPGRPGAHISPQWAAWRDAIDLGAYEARFDGVSAHGEADLIASLATTGSATVLDAGCGTGRVAIELARRGVDVAGVDFDADMIALARVKALAIDWQVADLATMDLGRTFDIVAMPGNVMLYCRTEDRALVVTACARHLVPGGLLVAGFSLNGGPGDAAGLAVDDYDTLCASAGLALTHRWARWDRTPFTGGDYAVSVHRSSV